MTSRWMRCGPGRLYTMVAMLCTAAICLMGGSCPPDGPTGPTWQLVLSNLPGGLLSVSGTTTGDIYAVGADPGDGDGPLVLHYDGQQWSRLSSGASGDLWWISDRQVGDSFYMGGEGGLLMRYAPASGQFDVFITPGNDTVFGVWGESESAIFACGGDVDDPETSGFVWRFDGAQWTNIDLSGIDPAGVPVCYKVWGRSASDVLVCGAQGLMLHFDGADWTEVDASTTRTLFTVHGNATIAAASGGAQSGALVEQGGSAFADVTPAGLLQMNGVFVPDTGEAVAVGIEGQVAFRRATGWEPVDTGLNLDLLLDYHAAWIDADGGVWAVGGFIKQEPRTSGVVSYFGNAIIGTTIAD